MKKQSTHLRWATLAAVLALLGWRPRSAPATPTAPAQSRPRNAPSFWSITLAGEGSSIRTL